LDTLEQRLCRVTHNGTEYAGEVRQIEPRAWLKVWVPELQQTLELNWVGQGDDYEGSNSSVNFYFSETVNRGIFSKEKVTKQKRTKTV
jgi:hypothetical protein